MITEPVPIEKFRHRKPDPKSFGFTAADLGTMSFPPIRWIVPGYIPEGCTLLAGRPKLGKSWLMLDVALAVARGAICLGDVECERGDVLYLALEDNKRRLQSRIRKVSTVLAKDTFPQELTFATEWPRCDAGGLDRIRAWLEQAQSPRLVAVDVLAQFRPARGEKEQVYESDYKAIKGLQELASEFNVAIVVVHHTRKGTSEIDPFEQISGTLGLSGAADAAIVLDRTGEGCTLYARGRDIEEYERAITFDPDCCRWTVQGDAAEVHRSDERGRIIAVLDDASEPLSPNEIAILADMKRNNVDRLLGKMGKKGEVVKTGRGKYLHPSKTEESRERSPTPGKNGKKVRSYKGEEA
jgi:hypothetical protein